MNSKTKFFPIFVIFFVCSLLLTAYKLNAPFYSIESVINQSHLSKNSIIAVSIRDVNTEKIVYQKDANLLLHPASALKALTTPVVLDVLGANYKLSTGIYKDNKGNIYLKLCGDPQLSTEELSNLILSLKSGGYNKIKGSLFVDDSEVDDIPWGTGWMWDDENNPYMPKYSAYNLNRNLISVKISPTKLNLKPKVEILHYYPVKIVNNAVTSNENDLSAERKEWKDSDTIYVEGKIASVTEIAIPVSNPEDFFKYRLAKALKDNKIKFSGLYKTAKLPENAVLISEISHNLIDELKITNKQSDNLAAESLFKIAGAKYSGSKGSTESGLKAFNEFYSKLGLNISDISIVDASGVSQNDLVTANWMSLALVKLSKNQNFQTYKNTLAVPSEAGTLKNRFSKLSGRLNAKTGTNAGVSSIVGFVTDKCGNDFAFSIIIQNFKDSSKPAKELENSILQVFE